MRDCPWLWLPPPTIRVLSGKYLDPDVPVPDARLNKFPGFYARYRTPECIECTARYAKIAADVSEPPMSSPWCCLAMSQHNTAVVVGDVAAVVVVFGQYCVYFAAAVCM